MWLIPSGQFKKKIRKQNKQNPIGVNSMFSHLILSLNNFSGKRNGLLHTKLFYRNCSEPPCSYLQVVFSEVESLVRKMRAFCLAFNSLQIRFLLTVMQLWKEVRPCHFLCDSISSYTQNKTITRLSPPPPFSHKQMGLLTENGEK